MYIVAAAVEAVDAVYAAANGVVWREASFERVAGGRMLQCGRDEAQAFLVALNAFGHVVQVVAHFSNHHRLFVQFPYVVCFDVETRELVIVARRVAAAAAHEQSWIRAAEHGEDDCVRSGHVTERSQILQKRQRK